MPSLQAVPLKPWARRGGKAAFLNRDAGRTGNDCHVMEIAPGGKPAPPRQLCEETSLILSGRGSPRCPSSRAATISSPPC